MLPYLIAGAVYGAIYAIAAASMTMTYSASGILNFAFGAQALFVARTYYFLHSQLNWGILPSAVLCIICLGPLSGSLLWFVLFRHLRHAPTLVKIVSTIGLATALPPIAVMLYGNVVIDVVPGLAPEPVTVYHFAGVAVTLDQIIALGFVVVMSAVGALVLRFTNIGLAVRAAVQSPALTAAFGTDPRKLELGVAVVTSTLAGIAGILVGPFVGLAPGNFTIMMAAALSAVVIARMQFIQIAVVAGLLIGALTGVLQAYVPPGGFWATAASSSLPFVIMAGALLYFIMRGRARESGVSGGALDRAIAVSVITRGVPHASRYDRPYRRSTGRRTWTSRVREIPFRSMVHGRNDALALALIAVVAILPLALSGIWLGFVGEGFAYALVFLSFTVVCGEGGIIPLCQITYAGLSALATAELVTYDHWPMIPAIAAAAVTVGVLGAFLGVIASRLGDLYIAVITLTFGILVDGLVFSLNTFYQYGEGIPLLPPHFAETTLGMTYFALAAFVVAAGCVMTLRYSSAGMAVRAARMNENGARATGISIVWAKVVTCGLGAFLAGLGGPFIALYSGAVITINFSTLIGLVWLAVLVTVGVRSNLAALVAGLSWSVVPSVFQDFVSTGWLLQLPTALFGAGAILLAINPDGAVATNARAIERILRRFMPVGPTMPDAVSSRECDGVSRG
jgi:branched-chain amino acid transport system permease protein